MCFVWISEQTAMLSLYSINWLVFITATGNVYCAVRTGSLYIIQGDSFSLRLLRGSPGSITLPMPHTHLHRHAAITRRTNGRSLGTFQKPMPFRKSVSNGQKSTFAQSAKVSKLSLQEGRAGSVLEPTQQYNFLVFSVLMAMYCLSLYRQPVSYFSPSSPPSSLSLRAVDSNVRRPSNLKMPNQCSRFSSGSIMDLVLQCFL